MKPKLQIDASLLKEFSCQRRVYIKSILGKSVPLPNINLVIGSAFHLFASEYVNTGEVAPALVEATQFFNGKSCTIGPDKQWMNGAYLMAMCTGFIDFYASTPKQEVLTMNGQKCLEKRFLYPYREYETVDMFLSGTIDMITINHDLKIIWIKDYKTTSLWDQSKFFKGFDMSIQLRFYRLLFRALLDRAGLFPDYEIRSRVVGVFIANNKAPIFKESSDILFRQQDLDDVKIGIEEKANVLAGLHKRYVEGKGLPYPEGIVNDTCERKFGLCDFYRACSKSNPIDELNISYVDSTYDPMTHGT